MTPSLPEWLADLPDHATIGSVEMAQIYGVSLKNVARSARRGKVPMWDYETALRASKRPGYRWSLGKIRKNVADAAPKPGEQT